MKKPRISLKYFSFQTKIVKNLFEKLEKFKTLEWAVVPSEIIFNHRVNVSRVFKRERQTPGFSILSSGPMFSPSLNLPLRPARARPPPLLSLSLPFSVQFRLLSLLRKSFLSAAGRKGTLEARFKPEKEEATGGLFEEDRYPDGEIEYPITLNLRVVFRGENGGCMNPGRMR